jgi:outer membrane protein assembly factor BamB
MKRYRVILTLLILFMSIFLGACSGSRVTASSWPGITVNEDTVYLSYNQHVYALQLENGLQRWKFPAEADRTATFFATPTITEDGLLVVGGYNNILYGLDAERNGQLLWTYADASNRYIGATLATDDGIYAPNADNFLYALTGSGQLRWKFEAERPIWAQPISDGETVYLSSMDHKLYALNAGNGNVRWERDLEAAVVNPPAFNSDGVLFVGTFGSEIIALDSSHGDILWRSPTSDWVWASPAVEDGQVYVVDLSGKAYAYDADSGDELWSIDVGGAITGTPLVIDETVYLATADGDLLALGTNGTIKWTRSIGGKLNSSPVSAGDMILVGAIEGEKVLVALDKEGTQLWDFPPLEEEE